MVDPNKYLNQAGGWTTPAGGQGGGAPTDASYVVTAAEAGLSNEKVLGTEIVMRGTLTSRPAAAIAGRLYFVTDAGAQRLTRDTGSVWEDCAVDWAMVGARPSTFPPSAHGHSEAELTLNFATHSSANDPSAGEKAALAGTSGTPGSGNKFVTDTDARNVNARTPTVHATSHQPGGSDAMAVDAAVGTGSLRTLGTGAQQACAGSDSRLSDSRTPLAHSHNAADVNAGTLAAARLPDATTAAKGAVQLATDGQSAASLVPQANDSRLSNARTPTAHTHSESEITNLVSDLAGKQAVLGFTPENSANKNAASGYAGLSAASKIAAAQMSGVLASSDLTNDAALEKAANKGAANGYAPLNASQRVPVANLASGTPDGTKFVRDDGTLAVPGGGADPWTYVRLTSDFVTNSASAVDVTGLAFTPAANQRYEIEGMFMLRTATATVNPRAGLAWPTGLTDGAALLAEAQAATGTPLFASGNPNASLLIAVGGLPNTTQSWPAKLWAVILAGASPSGTFKIQLASETAGTNVTMIAGSFIRYRTIP